MNQAAENWVKATFNSMTTEEKVAQLLHPMTQQGYTPQDWADIIRKVPVGAIYFSQGDADEMERSLRFIQSKSKIPILISDDMENGCGMFKPGGTSFPYFMSMGAIDKPDYAERLGRITARESRCRGVHWNFAPVCDLNLNPNNPVTNIRSLGDNPDKTIPLLLAYIRGLQDGNLMAATCKHFPGDGVDDRDQHMVTSVNSLPFDQYMELHGRVWKSVIQEAHTKCIMAGHISLPDFQGCQDDVDRALPATLSRKLQIELLREKLGFQGVLVSDAYPMIGFTSRFPEEELAWRNIESGSDSILFCDPIKDFEYLMTALRNGRLSEERVNESCLRLLRLKADLNLHQDCFSPVLSDEEYASHEQFSQQVADESVTVLRSRKGLLPVNRTKVKKVLTVTLERTESSFIKRTLDTVDQELKNRGLEVDHCLNPGHGVLLEAMKKYDLIFVNITTLSHAALQLRLTGAPAMSFWRSFYAQNPDKVVFTSFGSPYLLYEMPAVSNLMVVWGKGVMAQKAAVKAWFGEITPMGKLPVRPQKCRIRRWEY